MKHIAKTTGRLLAAALAAAQLMTAAAGAAFSNGFRYSYDVGEGISYTRMEGRNSAGNQRANILTYQPNTGVTPIMVYTGAKCLITLLGPLNRARKEETLIHEVLHAIFFEAGYLEHSEEMVDRLTPFLYSFIKENNLDKLFDEVNRN